MGSSAETGGRGLAGRLSRVLTFDRFSAEEFARLWLVATATYVVGDGVTTLAIVNHSAAMAATVDAFGGAGLIGLKPTAMLFGIGVSCYAARKHDRLLYYTPPVSLTVVGAFATAYDLRLLVG